MLPIAQRQNPPQKTVRPTVVACVAPLAFTFAFAFTLALTLACEGQEANRNVAAARPQSSLLAVGDTGDRWGPLPWLFEGQLAVGTAMRREHARAPVDALMLLGDNFYPDGLLATELVPRIVENVARPYCAFIDPSAELRPFLDGRCDRRREKLPRILAVIGNHDLRSPASLDLQRHEIPRYVKNWDMPFEDGPALRELPGGLSLILLVSESPWGDEQVDELAAALRMARGPWRVIVGHRPPIAGHPQLSSMVAHAAHESGHRIHLYLAAHVHVLAAIRGKGSAPALTVISGAGSHARRQREPEYRIEEADIIEEELGFVRVDTMAEPGPPRLRVTLFKAQPSAALAILGSPVIAQYEVSPDGRVERTDQRIEKDSK